MHFIYFRLCLPCICIYIQIKLVHEFFQILFPCLSDKSKFRAQLKTAAFFRRQRFYCRSLQLMIMGSQTRPITEDPSSRSWDHPSFRHESSIFLSKPGSWGFLLHLEETTESRDSGNKSQSDSRNLTKKRTAWSYCTRVSPKVGPSQFNCHSWMFIRSLGSLGPGSNIIKPHGLHGKRLQSHPEKNDRFDSVHVPFLPS